MECFVLPGDVVGSAEEFMPGEGTYLKGGYVRAQTAGLIQVDRKNRSANIIPKSNVPPKLQVGDIVVGRVTDLKESLAIIGLAFKKGYEARPLFNKEGLIHISHVKNTYVKDIHQALGLGDIVKAKIIDIRNGDSVGLSIVDKDLGVVKACCGKCNGPLRLENKKMVCSKCGQTENRKLSTDYGLGVIR